MVSKSESPSDLQHVIPRNEHTLSRSILSSAALKVLQRLSDAGYRALLVGGGVRDPLLDIKPKDFDVATDATPEQIHGLFKRSRIIGRRFQIVHVRDGREIIEVSTFRAASETKPKQSGKDLFQLGSTGQIIRDNQFGSIEEDAFRRDFTVNALYYDIKDFSLVDYTGGLEDLKQRKLKIIGDPLQRYREDPVRMIRAIRLASKLAFQLDPDTAAPIKENARLLRDVSPARLFEEVNKLFLAGYGHETYHMMLQYGLFEAMFPEADVQIRSSESLQLFISQALINSDNRVEQGKPVVPAFLFSVLLWPQASQRYQQLLGDGEPPIPALQKASQAAIAAQQTYVSIPRRFTQNIREIWELQPRLIQRRKNRIFPLLEHPRFRAAYDFLLLREQSGEQLDQAGSWWTDFQDANREGRDSLIDALPGNKRKRSKPRRRKPKNGNSP
ncbi:MAG: polynucleotide adenylyltransferase PcnB [Pseudomonadales bacterium]|nr:polynucleotide adenylyltransferase PcnB [Pseudomonadales bacterium]